MQNTTKQSKAIIFVIYEQKICDEIWNICKYRWDYNEIIKWTLDYLNSSK